MHPIHIERSMHRHIIHILALAAIITSCTAPKKDDIVPSTGAKVDLTLKITSVSPSTKTYIEEHTGEDGKSTFGLKWSNGDRLGLFLDSWGSSAKPSLEMENTAADGEDASFQGMLKDVLDGSHTLYTYAPASALTGTEQGKLIFEIKPEQFTGGGSFDPSADIVVGKGYKIVVKADNPIAEINNIRFSRLLATVMVSVSNKGTVKLDGESIRKITLTSKMPGAALSGTIQWDYESESISVISADNSVSAELEKPIPLDGTASAYILLNPITLSKGSSLVATLETQKHRITKTIASLPQDLNFPGNNISALKLSITDADTIIEEL